MRVILAGIDVHKKVLVVVVGRLTEQGFVFFRQKFNNTQEDIERMREWFLECGVQQVVMESTAQYWRTVWRELEDHWQLHLAQAKSNRAPRGRKNDFADAERLVRRLMADELVLSYVPDREQRLWRTIAREKYFATRARVQHLNVLEAFLEEARIKLSAVLSDLHGVSSWRMLRALAEGVTDSQQIAALADPGLKCSREKLCGALSAAPELRPQERILLKQMMTRIDLFSEQIEAQDRLLAECLKRNESAVARLAEIPGLGADSAQQMIAEVGPEVAAFASPKHLASWIGVCPGREESAGVSQSNRSPKGNRVMRRLLAQCANAAIKAKGCVFEQFYRRVVPRLGHNQAVWAVAHKLCIIIWKVLHDGVAYEERASRRNSKQEAKQLQRLKRTLRLLGYDPNSLSKLPANGNPAPTPA